MRLHAHRPPPARDRFAALFCLPLLALFVFARPAAAQSVNFFPADYQQQWTRIAIPPTHPVSNIPQWHIDAVHRTIHCDGNGGHEWLRFNQQFRNFAFRVQWRFTPLPGTTKYNSGVFFLNNADGSIWHQAQTSLAGGYLFGETPLNGKLTHFNLQKQMTENRIKPPGQWNTFDIRCVDRTCTLAVNGAVVNTLQVGVDKGYVGLEAEGYSIDFRNLKLQQLP
jgi:hypothetical protein